MADWAEVHSRLAGCGVGNATNTLPTPRSRQTSSRSMPSPLTPQNRLLRRFFPTSLGVYLVVFRARAQQQLDDLRIV